MLSVKGAQSVKDISDILRIYEIVQCLLMIMKCSLMSWERHKSFFMASRSLLFAEWFGRSLRSVAPFVYMAAIILHFVSFNYILDLVLDSDFILSLDMITVNLMS